MPPRVSRQEWDRRAAAVGIEWVGEEPILARSRHDARCTTCGHSWAVLPGHVQSGQGCPSCAFHAPRGPRVRREDWDHRAAAVGIEWVGDDPILAGSKHDARCTTCGYEWSVKPSHINDGQGCPSCAGRISPSREEWDRRALRAGVEWVGDDPLMSGTKHRARCLACGHEWDAWTHAVARGSGCRECAHVAHRTPREEWDRRAGAVGLEWTGDTPILARGQHPARCLTCSHEWDASVDSISNESGCPACAGVLKVTDDEWDRRAAAVGNMWLRYPTGAQGRGALRCLSCSHEWETSAQSVSMGSRCPACAGNAPVSREEWKRRAAAVRIEWIAEPPTSYEGSARALCLKCGHEYGASAASVSASRGCAACAPYGFDPSMPAVVYLLRHDHGPLMKVGVTRAGSVHRLSLHGGRGWEQIATWPVPLGRDALAIEKSVLEWWSASGARQCRREDVPGGDGWTEAVHIGTSADEPRTIAFIEERVTAVGGGSSG